MKELAKKLEEMFVNITFAEERDFSNARNDMRRFAEGIEDNFTAIAFTAVGEFETATCQINRDSKEPRSRRGGYPLIRFNKLCSGRA